MKQATAAGKSTVKSSLRESLQQPSELRKFLQKTEHSNEEHYFIFGGVFDSNGSERYNFSGIIRKEHNKIGGKSIDVLVSPNEACSLNGQMDSRVLGFSSSLGEKSVTYFFEEKEGATIYPALGPGTFWKGECFVGENKMRAYCYVVHTARRMPESRGNQP